MLQQSLISIVLKYTKKEAQIKTGHYASLILFNIINRQVGVTLQLCMCINISVIYMLLIDIFRIVSK